MTDAPGSEGTPPIGLSDGIHQLDGELYYYKDGYVVRNSIGLINVINGTWYYEDGTE
jgi:hypothetical protein